MHPLDDSIIARFCRKIPLAPDRNRVEAEDAAEVPPGIKLRLTVYNSPGTGIFDPPAEFRVSGLMTIFKTTVS